MLFSFSCKKNNDTSDEIISLDIENIVVSPHFNWRTDKDINIEIYAKDNNNNPLKNVKFQIFSQDTLNGGGLILSGVTDENGCFKRDYKVPKYYDHLIVTTDYIGLLNFVEVPIVNEDVEYIFGGKQSPALKSSSASKNIWSSGNFNFLGTYNNQGVPDYLEAVDDVIDDELLADINATFPEYQSVPVHHPEYLDDQYKQDLVLSESAEVWVTFVHEGAGWKNTLCFYTYDIDNPPASADDIDNLTVIFPNFSFDGNGGGLQSGNKVKIGNFSANTVIGWALVAQGWSNQNVTSGVYINYSDKNLNPDQYQQSILFNDVGRDLFLVGFEDIRRPGSYDDDFNDALFYATANPITSVNTDDMLIPDYVAVDTDTDGIPDNFDDYPDDPLKAFNNYFPDENAWGSLAFEDQWPGTGDYDFNDVVVDYRFNQISNADNKVVDIAATFVLRAFGASFQNGFGFQLPIANSEVENVSGIQILDDYINLDAKNLEQNQQKAVVIVFDNVFKAMPYHIANSIGLNTTPGAEYVTPDTFNVSVELANPQNFSTLGTPPYNPFIIANKQRGYEVHLSDYAPTDLADISLFNTLRDDSYPDIDRYYKTENNLPWAINILESFDYPAEKIQIVLAYNMFVQWAESEGTIFNDWYRDINSYRNNDKIYSH